MTMIEAQRMTDEGCPHDAPDGPGALPVPFHDYPHADRMRYVAAAEAAGAWVEGYVGPFLRVSLPRDAEAFFAALPAAGLDMVGRSWFFPLGSDNPPADRRHDGRYPGSAGFWLYANLRPAAPPSGPSDY